MIDPYTTARAARSGVFAGARRGYGAYMEWSQAAFVIDVLYWAHKAWHAVPGERRGPEGQPVNMVVGFANMLVRLLAERDPRWLCAAIDAKGATWRHELFPAYKAHRVAHPEGFDEQVAECVKLLELHGIPVLGAAGFEADDVMAEVAGRFRAAGIPVVLVTADKDLRQLVTDAEPAVILWDGKDRYVGERTVMKEWGVTPGRAGDYLALVGDDGDGVPGVPGVGPKGAPKLLADSRDLEHMLSIRQWAQSAVGRSLRENMEQLRLSRRLVELRRPPLDVGLAACAVGGFDVEGLAGFYRRAGLGQLEARLDGAPAKRAVDPAAASAWAGGVAGGGSPLHGGEAPPKS